MSELTELVQRARHYHISDIPKRSAKRNPDKLALVDGHIKLSYQEFYKKVEQLAAYLAEIGLKKSDRLLLLSHNCWQFPVIHFAAARLGVLTVPVNFMLNSKELAYILENSQTKIIFAEDQLTATVDAAMQQCQHQLQHFYQIDLNQAPTLPKWQNMEQCFNHNLATLPHQDLNAYEPIRMMYTSGTESLPKGVLLNSEALMWQYMSAILEGEMSANDREIHAFPLYHCAQFDAFLNVDLYLGATSYILRGFDPNRVLDLIAKEKINKLFCPPTAWIALLNAPSFDHSTLNSLQKAYYGASAMPKRVISTLLEKLPHIRFWQFYGQTEMAPVATVLYPEDHYDYPTSVGRPVFHVETAIMNEDGQLLEAGEIGEIVHKSPHLTLGYANQPEKTAEAFLYGWFHSGDLGYFDDTGHLYIVDRIKDMVKTGGENVSTREVEEVIYRFDGIKEVAVFGISHPHWIEAVTAIIVLQDPQNFNVDHLFEHCKQHLSTYKMPKSIHIATELPKNASGKILKRQLRQQYQDHYSQDQIA
jgi:fatty-acyl-CoA synthase